MEKCILALILAVGLALGCGTWKQYDPTVLIEGEPALVSSGRFGGQGHLIIKTEGVVTTVEVVQFGVSDVLGGTIKGFFSDVAGVFGFGGNPEPPEITINVPTAPAAPAVGGKVEHVVVP